MDEWRDFYYSMNPGARNVEIGDLSPRKKLRDDLKAGLSLPGNYLPLTWIFVGRSWELLTWILVGCSWELLGYGTCRLPLGITYLLG